MSDELFYTYLSVEFLTNYIWLRVISTLNVQSGICALISGSHEVSFWVAQSTRNILPHE